VWSPNGTLGPQFADLVFSPLLLSTATPPKIEPERQTCLVKNSTPPPSHFTFFFFFFLPSFSLVVFPLSST